MSENKSIWRHLWSWTRVLLRVNGVATLILLVVAGILYLQASHQRKNREATWKPQIAGLEKVTTIQRVLHHEKRVPGKKAGLCEFFEVETAAIPDIAFTPTENEQKWGDPWRRWSNLSPAWTDVVRQLAEIAHEQKCDWFPSAETIRADNLWFKVHSVILRHGKITRGTLVVSAPAKQRVYSATVRSYLRE